MIRRALLIAVALLAVHAAAAQARPFDAEAETYYQEALTYWQLGTPSCGDPARELVPSPLEQEGRKIGGYFDIYACKIVVAEGNQPCVEKDIVFHETGHSLGLDHSSDPTAIMAPTMPVNGGHFCEEEHAREEARFWGEYEAERMRNHRHNLSIVRRNKRRLHHAWAVKAPKLEKGRAL